MKLRTYQLEAIGKVKDHLVNRSGNPCICIPTGGGKTPIIASLARDFIRDACRVLIVAHRKELISQINRTLGEFPGIDRDDVGVYAAGMKASDTDNPIIIAQIQSVSDKANTLTRKGKIDFLIVDEAHMIPALNRDRGERDPSRFRRLVRELEEINPGLRVIGMTATPYRTDSGMIANEGNVLNEICYNITVRELIDKGFLSKIVSRGAEEKRLDVDLEGVKTTAGDFNRHHLQQKFGKNELVNLACVEIARRTVSRNKVLVFSTGVAHARKICDQLNDLDGCESAKTIFGSSASDSRDATIREFQEGGLKYLVNCEVLTTGFDSPIVDAIVVLRPTQSPGLWYQMVGRGLRRSQGKADCLVLDFGGNICRHGPIDKIHGGDNDANNEGANTRTDAWKYCPHCKEAVPIKSLDCPECGMDLRARPDWVHAIKASVRNAINGDRGDDHADAETIHIVTGVGAQIHQPRDSAKKKSLRVMYKTICLSRENKNHSQVIGEISQVLAGDPQASIDSVDMLRELISARGKKVGDLLHYWGVPCQVGNVSEWLCFDHNGWARQIAKAWLGLHYTEPGIFGGEAPFPAVVGWPPKGEAYLGLLDRFRRRSFPQRIRTSRTAQVDVSVQSALMEFGNLKRSPAVLVTRRSEAKGSQKLFTVIVGRVMREVPMLDASLHWVGSRSVLAELFPAAGWEIARVPSADALPVYAKNNLQV